MHRETITGRLRAASTLARAASKPLAKGFRPCHALPASRPRRSALQVRAVSEVEKTKAAAPASAPSGKPAPQPPTPPTPPPRKEKQGIRAEVVFDKAVDAGLDIYRHVRRLALPKPTSLAMDRMIRGSEGRFQLKREAGRPIVLVLGSGWAAHSCIKVIDTDRFDVFVVSPRNFFCFTPMLPSTAVGTVEFRSLLEPIRTSNEFVGYLEAACDQLDIENKVATCTANTSYDGGQKSTFELPYDILVVAVGEQPATLGVPGVSEYCCFMKEISDTVTIRNKIGGCFEAAALPGTTDEDRRKLLHFVVVGGGPTGVEFAGTLSDYVRSDLRRKYPQLMPYVKVSLLQSAETILTQFDSKLAGRALENLNQTGVDVRTGVRVVEVTQKEVVLKGGDRLPYGLCVWSCGNAARPLVQSLVSMLPEQAQYQRGNPNVVKLAVDGYQRVVGAKDTLALGDCCYVVGDTLPTTAQVAAQQGAYMAHVINRGYIIGSGGVDSPPPCRPLPKGLTLPGLNSNSEAASYAELAAAAAEPGAKVTYCRQQFEFVSLGIMAYVGDDKALTQIEAGDNSLNLYGGFAYLLWRSVYITKQVSLRNRVLILFDWIKAQVFGRDLSMF